eukprot:5627077-Pleurochrysis_carterae.AAC.1
MSWVVKSMWHEALALGKRLKYWFFRRRLWRFVCVHECPGLFHEFNTLRKNVFAARDEAAAKIAVSPSAVVSSTAANIVSRSVAVFPSAAVSSSTAVSPSAEMSSSTSSAVSVASAESPSAACFL